MISIEEILRGQGIEPGTPASAAQPQGNKLNWGAIIADALSGLAGQQGQYPQRVARQQAAEQEEVQWGRRREAELQDYGRKLEMQNDPRYAKPSSPYRFEDNAGNVWEMGGADPTPRRVFTDMAPKQYVQDGMLITAPNPYNTGAAPAAASPPDTIDENLWNTGKPVGGQAPAPGGFRRSY